MVLVYAAFVAFVGALLALDLGVFHRKARVVRVKEALGWSAVWIGLGLAFSGLVYVAFEHHWFGLGATADASGAPTVGADGVTYYNDGASAAIKYLTGFVVEKALAVDNIFVIAMIFGFVGVPERYQHRVLLWGVVGALLMRGLMIGVGAVVIARFDWILYVFAAFLLLTGVKMLVVRGAPSALGDSAVVRLARRILPVSDRLHGERFFVRAAGTGARLVTPLFLALLLVELTDVIFAVDSIPAIFAITTDPFLVFTSNVFAILGMRSLYFALAGAMQTLRHLKTALAVVLLVIGAKMLAHAPLEAWLGASFNLYVLAVVGAILAAGVVASLASNRRRGAPALAGTRAPG